ncbi:MAG TPA: AMIN domain-containing protein [bacterium]|nr:AMIN domain-containing protein [bacterium]
MTAITGSQIGDETAITIVATQPVRYRLRNVRSDWIVIDIPGTQLGRPAGQVPVVRGLVKRVRVGQFMPDIVRVVVELIQPAEFHLATTSNRQAIVVGIPLDIGGHLVARAQAVGYQTVVTQTDAVAIGPENMTPQGTAGPAKTTSAPTTGTEAVSSQGLAGPVRTTSAAPTGAEAASPQGPVASVKTVSPSTVGTGTPNSPAPAASVKSTSPSTAGTEAVTPQGPTAPVKTVSPSTVGTGTPSSPAPAAPVKTTSPSTAGTEAVTPQGPTAPVKTVSPSTVGTGTPSSPGPAAPVKTTGASTAGTVAATPQGPVGPEKTTGQSAGAVGTPSSQAPPSGKTVSAPSVNSAATGPQTPLAAPKGVTNPQAKIRDVTPGRYIGPARLGMNVQDLVAAIGPSASTDHLPDGTTVYRWFKAPKNAGIGVRVSADGIIYRVWILNDAGYATTQRLHAGSTEAEIRAALGEPSQSFINTDQKLKTLTYGALGIWFSIQLDDRYLFYNTAFEIGVMQPR